MFTYLEGKLVSATPLLAIVDLQGHGYEIHIPVTTAERLPAIGKTVRLQTHVVYREDQQSVYGFSTKEDRDFFRILIEKVPGVGPKVGLSIMSKLSLPMLRSAIANKDIVLLTKVPGIGKKTAERLIIELKDKLAPAMIASSAIKSEKSTGGAEVTTGGVSDNAVEDAVRALITLGYRAPAADKAVRQAVATLDGPFTSEELLKTALKQT